MKRPVVFGIVTVVCAAVMTLFIPLKLNPEGVEFIKKHEAFSSRPYYDQGGRATIGYGSTRWIDGTPVKITDKPISESHAYYVLIHTLGDYEWSVHSNVDKSLTQSQYNALVSFAYNCGTEAFEGSTLLKMVNKDPTDPQIIRQFYRWIYVKGKVSKGLIKRREAEIELYFKEPYLFPERDFAVSYSRPDPQW